MKILLAYGEQADLEMISTLLLAEGHELIATRDGRELLELMQGHPDLVILEANLQGMSGFECCRHIKHDESLRDKLVVLLINSDDAVAWARFSECGADDFIEHPLHPNAVKAKFKLLLHIHELYLRLEAAKRHTEQEIRIAKHMFDSIIKRQPSEIDFLHFWSLSAGHFCGDLFVFERTPDDHLHVFLGDFTGHGLSAAMGALPVSDIFFAMTRKGCGISQIALEMNRKLFEILPTGKFCSAILLRLDADNSKLEIWNGGVPPLLLVNSQRKIMERCESFHLPLGIADPSEIELQTRHFDLAGVHSIVFNSDGLVEAQNTQGECFGEDRLAQMINRKTKDGNIFNGIKSSLLTFLEGLEPHDDVSLVVMHIN